MRTTPVFRPARLVLALAAAALLPAACADTPVDIPTWHVTVVPARDDPSRMVVLPPDCAPVPTTLSDPEIRPGPWHNRDLGMGCANARNLAVMIEQPRDLVGGRTLGLPDAEREAAAIQRYRAGQEKPLRRESTRGESSGAE